jgi:NAD(P)-dependent dehydrogenase (short-subunit alcohol dehydrogenase family)
MDFQGKAVLITGGAGGIGSASAKAFADAGAAVVISDVNAELGAAVEDGFKKASADIHFFQSDVTDSGACDRLVQDTVAKLGRLDVLVNCVGVLRRATALEATDSQWLESMAGNVDGVFYMCRAAAPVMKEQGSGVIINISSEMGRLANPKSVPYCVSKAAVLFFTRLIAVDLAAAGVRVNVVAPGGTRTAMLEESIRLQGMELEEGLVQYSKRVPMKRFADMEEMTNAILFIASDEASYITGATLSVDGGTTVAGPGVVPDDRPTT